MRWEKTFELSAPVAEVWKAVQGQSEGMKLFDPDNAYFTGGACRVEYKTKLEGVELEWDEVAGDDVWNMRVTFEETDTGSRITLVRSGFGEGDEWTKAATARLLGWEQVFHDFEIFTRTGQPTDRFHGAAWGASGLDVVASTGGVRVLGTFDGSLAASAGVQPGDVLIGMAGLPVFGLAEFWLIERVVRRDGAAEFQVMRGDQLVTLAA